LRLDPVGEVLAYPKENMQLASVDGLYFTFADVAKKKPCYPGTLWTILIQSGTDARLESPAILKRSGLYLPGLMRARSFSGRISRQKENGKYNETPFN
jgi:hypothetical protein